MLRRHPRTPGPCVPPGLPGVHIEDRSYLLLLGLEPGAFRAAYPGRKYFFDLGTARFPSGLAWFVEEYRRRGVEFDEIWVSLSESQSSACQVSAWAAALCAPRPPVLLTRHAADFGGCSAAAHAT